MHRNAAHYNVTAMGEHKSILYVYDYIFRTCVLISNFGLFIIWLVAMTYYLPFYIVLQERWLSLHHHHACKQLNVLFKWHLDASWRAIQAIQAIQKDNGNRMKYSIGLAERFHQWWWRWQNDDLFMSYAPRMMQAHICNFYLFIAPVDFRRREALTHAHIAWASCATGENEIAMN